MKEKRVHNQLRVCRDPRATPWWQLRTKIKSLALLYERKLETPGTRVVFHSPTCTHTFVNKYINNVLYMYVETDVVNIIIVSCFQCDVYDDNSEDRRKAAFVKWLTVIEVTMNGIQSPEMFKRYGVKSWPPSRRRRGTAIPGMNFRVGGARDRKNLGITLRRLNTCE